MEVRAAVALDVVWIGLTVVAVLAFLASVASLVQGIRLRGGVRRGMRLALGAFLPSIVLILPVRGLDEGFDENVRALLSQSYSRYRLLVVADDSSDPASARIETVVRMGRLVCGSSRSLERIAPRGPMAGSAERRPRADASGAGSEPQDCVRAGRPRADL